MITLEPALVLMEDHDEAYAAWKKAEVKERVLFHFDAHIDFAWISPSAESLLSESTLENFEKKLRSSPIWNLSGKREEERIHLGNYIHQAIQSGMVREFVWIYPDDPRKSKQFKAVEFILKGLADSAPNFFESRRSKMPGGFEGRIYGKPFFAMPFSSFRSAVPDEEVLLDIDLDFFITHALHSPFYPYSDPSKPPRFWLSPETFVRTLKRHQLLYDHVTISYSVEEGYTPLSLKFLGDELAKRITGHLSEAEDRHFSLLRERFEPGHARKTQDARLDPLKQRDESDADAGAALHFDLALAHLEQNQNEKARDHYSKALEADLSYRTAYNHPGPVLLFLNRPNEAAASYARMKILDPSNPHYRLYDFEITADKKKWREAVLIAEALLKDGFTPPTLRLRLSECYFHLRRFEDAYQILASYVPTCAIADPHDISYYYRKARALEKLGRWEEALESYQALSRYLIRNLRLQTVIQMSQAQLYFKRGQFSKAARHARRALARILVWPFLRSLKFKGPREVKSFLSFPASLSETLVLKRRADIKWQTIEGSVVLIDASEGKAVRLNEIGSQIWQVFDSVKTLKEIFEDIEKRYDAPKGAVRKDASRFVEHLIQMELVLRIPTAK